jgi:hypothetical protein
MNGERDVYHDCWNKASPTRSLPRYWTGSTVFYDLGRAPPVKEQEVPEGGGSKTTTDIEEPKTIEVQSSKKVEVVETVVKADNKKLRKSNRPNDLIDQNTW